MRSELSGIFLAGQIIKGLEPLQIERKEPARQMGDERFGQWVYFCGAGTQAYWVWNEDLTEGIEKE